MKRNTKVSLMHLLASDPDIMDAITKRKEKVIIKERKGRGLLWHEECSMIVLSEATYF